MICYKDKTFCASKIHKPECDRQITQEELDDAKFCDIPIAWAYFCGEYNPELLDKEVQK